MPLTITVILITMIALGAPKVWLFCQFGARRDYPRSPASQRDGSRGGSQRVGVVDSSAGFGGRDGRSRCELDARRAGIARAETHRS